MDVPGLFDPWRAERVEFSNRIVVSPMCQYMADEAGHTTDWHLVHYGSLALGGAGLVMVEATAVEARGRISPRDVGLFSDSHVPGLRRIVDFAHGHGARIGIQLAHAGRKADLPDEIVAPSAVRFSDHYQVPRALAPDDLEAVAAAFAAAARRAVAAGFDLVEVHAAHGYLLHEFLSPLSNVRPDEYGGTAARRASFPLRVIGAVRAAVAGRIPVGMRISASEYRDDGFTLAEAADFCRRAADGGIAFVDVSSGGNVPAAPPAYPGYQVPLAEAVKKSAGVPVIAVGMLDDPHLAEFVVASGKADAVAVARGFLRDKHWAHRAAIALGRTPQPPAPYRRAY